MEKQIVQVNEEYLKMIILGLLNFMNDKELKEAEEWLDSLDFKINNLN